MPMMITRACKLPHNIWSKWHLKNLPLLHPKNLLLQLGLLGTYAFVVGVAGIVFVDAVGLLNVIVVVICAVVSDDYSAQIGFSVDFCATVFDVAFSINI